MAKVSGAPAAFAASTNGLSCAGCCTFLSSSALVSVIAWPFRFKQNGMTIGFFGDPCRPRVEP